MPSPMMEMNLETFQLIHLGVTSLCKGLEMEANLYNNAQSPP